MNYYNYSLRHLFILFNKYSLQIYSLSDTVFCFIYYTNYLLDFLSHFVIFQWAEYSRPIPNKTKMLEIKIEASSLRLKCFVLLKITLSLMFFEKEQLILSNSSFSTPFTHVPY